MGPWDRTLQVDGPTGLFETANLLIARSRFDALGGFEPWLAPRRSKELAEDAWLGWRALRAGATSVFAPDAVVAHAVLPGTPRTYVAERLRLRFFPLILRRIPELRGTPLHRRLLPHPDPAGHARRLWARARPWGRRAPLILAVDVVADLVGLAALGWGWATARRAAL
jgi:GT2 family glycosyltransferase